MSLNIYNVAYTHAAGNSGSAARGARYITRRPQLTREERDSGAEPTRESEWREIEHVGDEERFVEEANRRWDGRRGRAKEGGKDLSKDRSPGAAQYVHVVISPKNGERRDEQEDHRAPCQQRRHRRRTTGLRHRADPGAQATNFIPVRSIAHAPFPLRGVGVTDWERPAWLVEVLRLLARPARDRPS